MPWSKVVDKKLSISIVQLMVKRRIEGNDDDEEFSSKRVQQKRDQSDRKQVRQKQDRSDRDQSDRKQDRPNRMQLRPNRDRSKKGIEYNEDLKRKQKKKSKPIEIKESSSDSSSEDQGCENEYEADMLDDAKKYEKALQNTLQFVTCGVCGYEGSVTKFLNRKDGYRPMKFPGKSIQDIIDGSKRHESMTLMNTFHIQQFYIKDTYRRAIEAEYKRLSNLNN